MRKISLIERELEDSYQKILANQRKHLSVELLRIKAEYIAWVKKVNKELMQSVVHRGK